jgi:hypothetical protein
MDVGSLFCQTKPLFNFNRRRVTTGQSVKIQLINTNKRLNISNTLCGDGWHKYKRDKTLKDPECYQLCSPGTPVELEIVEVNISVEHCKKKV